MGHLIIPHVPHTIKKGGNPFGFHLYLSTLFPYYNDP
jgi:hypothetical protein